MAVTADKLPAEFAGVDATTAAFWIAQAEAAVDRPRWLCAGADPDQGVLALASHYLKAAGLGDDEGTELGAKAKSERIGDVATTNALGSEADGEHGGTPYGTAFDTMLDRVRSHRGRRIARPQPL